MSIALAQKPSDFSLQHCEPCHKNTKALSQGEAEIWLQALSGWSLDDKTQWLSKSFSFRNFAQALSFVNAIGDVAEKENHHPDVSLGWGYVHVKSQTHAIGGLHRNDFILASKIDKIAKPA